MVYGPLLNYGVNLVADTLCDGRTIEQFDNEGTGVGLWIQNGTDPVEDSVRMPETQDEANRSAWTEGSCFITMGTMCDFLGSIQSRTQCLLLYMLLATDVFKKMTFNFF